MNCPKCTGKLKRTRTRDHGNSVERYNRCLSCGQHYKTVEMFLADYEHQINTAIIEGVANRRRIEDQAAKLKAISEAFGTIHDIVKPLREAEQAKSDDAGDRPGRWHRHTL